MMTRKVVYIGGTSLADLSDEFGECMDYVEQVMPEGLSPSDGFRERAVNDATSHVERAYTWDGGPHQYEISVVAKYPSRPESEGDKTPEECLATICQMEDTDELVVAHPRKINAESAVDLVGVTGELTIASCGVTVRADTPAEDIHRLLPAIANVETTVEGDEILQQQWNGGRPPVGTETDRGRLVKGENFEQIRSTLQNVVFGGKSKSQAAREIGCARKTVGNTLRDRPELYDLPRQ